MRISKNDISRAVKILKNAGVIAAATETAYGLIADALSARAVRKIFLIKSRSKNKPLPLIAASPAMVKEFFFLSRQEAVLARKYWPGPLTMLLKPKKKFPGSLAAGRKKLAVRVSSSAIIRRLSAALGNPVTSTSANRSGAGECYSAICVEKAFTGIKNTPDMILDTGVLARVLPSTIIEVSGDKIKVLRQGPIKIKN